jgi:putative ABC transport system substrate-binding protein
MSIQQMQRREFIAGLGGAAASPRRRGDRVRRREFITGLGGAAAWPLVARAQQPPIPRVGYVWVGTPDSDVGIAGLRQGLADRGYVVGRSLLLEARYAEGHPERVSELIAALLARNVDVLATPGTVTTRAAQRATSSVPIVCTSGDPVGAGLVKSLSHPGGNITCLSLLSGDYSAKWLELLKEMLPRAHQVAALWNPDNQAVARQIRNMRDAGNSLGLELEAFSARPADVETSLTAIATTNVDALIVTDDPYLGPLVARIVAFTAEHRLPALYGFGYAVRRGGLMSYSSDFGYALWRRAAEYVDRILKGARPAELPVQQATEVTLRINLKTAKALGLDIPPSLLARADEVIE